MAVERGFGKLRRAGVLGLLLLAAGPNDAARAFSDPAAYADLAINGGGAGRWFTGSPADGYGCDVCHEGAPGVDLALAGLPADGVVPGTPYEVTLTWPATVQHVALLAEFTDELRQGAGTLALPQPEVTPAFERCTGEEEGFPASALVQAADGLTPCDLAPPASAAPSTPTTFTPTPRCIISVVDCGARLLRFQWTAPAVIPGRLWFNAGFIVTNDDAQPGGDGVTLVSMPLAPAGTSLAERTVAQGCAIAAPADRPSSLVATVALVLLATLALRRRATSRRQAPRAGRRSA